MLKRSAKNNKPTIVAPTKKNQGEEAENIKPVCFNTKGYFTSDQPYDPQYLKVKQEVFKKYRKNDAELLFIDPKMTKPSAFIQRGMLIPNNHIYNDGNQSDKLLNNFLKNYISRKEKRENQDEQRYFGKKRQTFGAMVQNQNISRSSRPATKSVYSRISTARSIFSSVNHEI